MSILNPNVKLAQLPIGVTWAKLEATEVKDLRFDFLVNPTEVVWQHQANVKDLAVLHTEQPLTWYTGSQSSLNLPSVYLWTPNQSGNIQQVEETLRVMTKPSIGKDRPPILKLTWGDLVQPRLYLKSCSIREQQWRSGKPTMATAALDFVIAPESPQVLKSDFLPQLSDRETRDYANRIKNTLKKNKALAKSWGVDTTKDSITVSASGVISINGKPKGNLKDTFPDLLKPGHKNI